MAKKTVTKTRSPKSKTTTVRSSPHMTPKEINEAIRKQAYAFFEQKGRRGGEDWADWFEAERQIKESLR